MTPSVPSITDPSWTRAHPFGLVCHPNWKAVENRYAELHARSIKFEPSRTFLERIFDR